MGLQLYVVNALSVNGNVHRYEYASLAEAVEMYEELKDLAAQRMTPSTREVVLLKEHYTLAATTPLHRIAFDDGKEF